MSQSTDSAVLCTSDMSSLLHTFTAGCMSMMLQHLDAVAVQVSHRRA
jgi:hypothetical protein